MTRQSIIVTIIVLLTIFDLSAKKTKEYPRAEIKVGYTYHETFVRGSDGIVNRDIPFINSASASNSPRCLTTYSINANTITRPTVSSPPSSRNGGFADANCCLQSPYENE